MTARALDKKRLYNDGCAAAHAMDLIGERWALLVVRELMLGPKRFNDIRRNLHGLSANILSQRLEELERHEIVVRRTLPPPASVQVYDLTPWGRELEPVFQTLGRWAVRSPFKPEGPMSVNSMLMSFATMFDPSKAKGLSARVSMEIDGEPCHLIIKNQTVTAERGELTPADLCIEASAGDLLSLFYDGADPAEWPEWPGVSASGNLDLLARLPSVFPVPAPFCG